MIILIGEAAIPLVLPRGSLVGIRVRFCARRYGRLRYQPRSLSRASIEQSCRAAVVIVTVEVAAKVLQDGKSSERRSSVRFILVSRAH
jgi:hypothetical protein